jgi:hypothetical protein
MLLALALAAIGTSASGQTSPDQPYAELQQRQIKAMSSDQLAELRDGHGMGLALVAELNGYPGPRHVLDLSDALALTGQQRAGIERLFAAMKAEAVALGERLIAAERNLDREFAERTISLERLQQTTAAIAAIRGELRNTHLKHHVMTEALLTPQQIRRYAELRGYAGGSSGHPKHRHGATAPNGPDARNHSHHTGPGHRH